MDTACFFKARNSAPPADSSISADARGHNLRDAIRRGRLKFLEQFPSLANEETQRRLADPARSENASRCKLDFSERETNRQLYDLHIDLMKLRREDSRFREQTTGGVDGAVLGPEKFRLAIFCCKLTTIACWW